MNDFLVEKIEKNMIIIEWKTQTISSDRKHFRKKLEKKPNKILNESNRIQ